jgi:pimeloyl-ACP methyl ester carboxylesterase
MLTLFIETFSASSLTHFPQGSQAMRLRAIQWPTRIEIPLRPAANGQLLAESTPNAELALVSGVGHVPMTEQPSHVAALADSVR